MNQNATYLEVTIRDNDFRDSLAKTCQLLYEVCKVSGRYPTEEDLPNLKEAVKHIWFGLDDALDILFWRRPTDVGIDYLEPQFRFVDFSDIQDENLECAYIPMFNGGFVFIR